MRRVMYALFSFGICVSDGALAQFSSDGFSKQQRLRIDVRDELSDRLESDEVLRNASQLERFLLKRDAVIVPVSPEQAGASLNKIALELRLRCRSDMPIICDRSKAYDAAASRLRAAAVAHPTCDFAAKQFRATYSAAAPSAGVARNYDLACLGSFVARKDDTALEPRLSLLGEAENSGGMLEAVGILYVNGSPYCAGLIRNDRTFITAKHCVTQGGKFELSSASGNLTNIPLTLKKNGDWTRYTVRYDWAVLEMPPGPALNIARTNLVPLQRPSPVSFVALYPYEANTDYVRAEVLPKRALRYPRAGMCEAVNTSNGCLQLACQTVRGFSGAPIFSSRRADGSYDVVGFISASEGSDTGCVGEDIPNSTFAVSSELVG